MRIITIIFFVVIACIIEIALEVSLALRRTSFEETLETNKWVHPNAICVWRTILAFIGMVVIFQMNWFLIGVAVFTFAALLDRLDGIIARDFNKVTETGKWLDPLADKLTYLPYIIFFAYSGYFSINLTWVLVCVESFGQVGRRIISIFGGSIAANKIGKAKAVFCYSLVAYGLLLYDGLNIANIGDSMLIVCIALSALSFITKAIPISWYEKLVNAANRAYF